MIALIDGDIVAYRCGFAGQKTKYKASLKGEEGYGYVTEGLSKGEMKKYESLHPNNEFVLTEEIIVDPLYYMLHSVDMTIDKILSTLGTTKYRIYLTGKGNFRYNIFPDYKKTRRVAGRKPLALDGIISHLLKEHHAEIINGYEADDALGVAQGDTGDTCICTIDKDLKMIPGDHYNWVTNKQDWVSYNKATVTFFRQVLVGDPTDDIVGIYGVGPATAKQLIPAKTSEQEMWDKVKQMYLNIGRTKEDALLVSQLIWIKRNFETNWWEDLNVNVH